MFLEVAHHLGNSHIHLPASCHPCMYIALILAWVSGLSAACLPSMLWLILSAPHLCKYSNTKIQYIANKCSSIEWSLAVWSLLKVSELLSTSACCLSYRPENMYIFNKGLKRCFECSLILTGTKALWGHLYHRSMLEEAPPLLCPDCLWSFALTVNAGVEFVWLYLLCILSLLLLCLLCLQERHFQCWRMFSCLHRVSLTSYFFPQEVLLQLLVFLRRMQCVRVVMCT